MSTGNPILYSRWRSSCSWRVRIALNLKGISYEQKAVALPKPNEDNHSSEEIRKVNPMGQIPAMIIGKWSYNSRLCGNYALFGRDTSSKPSLALRSLQKGQSSRDCSDHLLGIQPLQNITVLYRVGEEKKQLEWAQHYISRGFSALEKILSNSAGKFCVGDEITMADICLVPQVSNAMNRFKMDLREYPTIVRINKELESHPAFIAAHPFRQPDCPEDLKVID